MTYILFDIGANHGQDSINQTKNNENIITYAFEPMPILYGYLDTARKNGFEWDHFRRDQPIGENFEHRYNLYNLALSDYDGSSEFYVADIDPHGDWGASSLYKFVDHVAETWPGRKDLITTKNINVTVSRFDTWFEQNNINIDKIDYFHCDTQGSDLRVLKGMGKYLSLIKEGVVECARDERAKLYAENHTVNEMVEFLESNGFRIVHKKSNDPWSNEFNVYFEKL